jgi:hypothetical protein
MNIRHACAVFAAALAALVLSGCFVVSTNAPTGSGPINDERLVGAWRGFDADDQKDADAYLHFLRPDEDKPLRLVWVEGDKFQVYEVRTMMIGGRNVFAATIVEPKMEAEKDGVPFGYYLGFYEFKSQNDLVFHLLDAKKVGELIDKGVVRGTKPPRQYDMTTLTGSPSELARFLASPQALAARMEDPAHLRRLSRGKR